MSLKREKKDKIKESLLKTIYYAENYFNIFVIININTDIIMSLGVATPTITLNGAENGDENGIIDDIKFKLLVGLVIVKYAK